MAVFLTDFSLLSSLGNDEDTFWKALRSGETGIRSIAERVSETFPIQQAAVLADDSFLPEISEMRMQSEVEKSFSFLLRKLSESGLRGSAIDGLVWTSGQYGRKVTDFYPGIQSYESFTESGSFLRQVQSLLKEHKMVLKSEANLINQSNACVTGITALGSACKRIQMGQWERALVFLHESRCREWVLSPYLQMRLLSLKEWEGELKSSPFSKDRSGFVKGEGAVLLLLESEKAYRERKAQPWASILSWAQKSSGEQITRMSDSNRSALDVLETLFQSAKANASSLDYINGYGSASPVNDLLETNIYKKFWKEKAYEIPISVGKPQFGHLNTAAVGLELVSTLLMMKHQEVAPTIHLQSPDPACDLDYVPLKSRKHRIRMALKMAFGFGWSNAGLLLRSME